MKQQKIEVKVSEIMTKNCLHFVSGDEDYQHGAVKQIVALFDLKPDILTVKELIARLDNPDPNEIQPIMDMLTEVRKQRSIFEPKPEATYRLKCDKCGMVFESAEAFPLPQLCPKCQSCEPKPEKIEGLPPDQAAEKYFTLPDEGRLLSDEDVAEALGVGHWSYLTNGTRQDAEAIALKTAQYKDAEIAKLQERLSHKYPDEQIEWLEGEHKLEIAKLFEWIEEHMDEAQSRSGTVTVRFHITAWQSLKSRYLNQDTSSSSH